MGVVQPGGGQKRGRGQERGQRPGPPGGGRGPAQARRPPAKDAARGAPSGRAAPATRGGRGPGAGKPKGRRSVPVEAAPPRRFSPTTLAFISVAVVVVVVVVLVAVRVTRPSASPANNLAPVRSAASPSVLAQVEIGVGAPVVHAVGLPSSVRAPSLDKGQPALTFGGKPGALYIGGEFCPICAAERWAIVMAFSRFGSFTGLKETTSSPWDTPIDTFSFYGATYTSNYLDFRPIENVSNDTGPNEAGRKILTPLTSQESSLWAQYDSHFGVQQGFPFLDIGNKVFVIGESYDGSVLEDLTQAQIAAKLQNAQNPITQGIVGTANYLTAAICSITGNQPASVCSAPIVTQASHALGVS